MNFLEALRESERTGYPIKRSKSLLFGIIIFRNGGFKKFAGEKDVYDLDKEDILATDWEIEKFN